MFRQRINNLRNDIPEARQFIYPDDNLRVTPRKAAELGGLVAVSPWTLSTSLRGITEAIQTIRSRPDATPGMHEAYLNNKYGVADWDTYINRNEGTGYNPAYEYVEKDYGTASELVRENKRFAGKTLSDEWMADIKGYGQAQDALEEVVEQNRQRGVVDAIHGKSEAAAFLDPSNPSRTTEQQLSYDLLYNGTMPDAIPPDRILGKDVSPDIKREQQGVSNEDFKPDSEVRRDVQGGLDDNGTLNLDRRDTRTEIYSPQEIDSSFDEWKLNQEGSWTPFDNSGTKTRNDYNRDAAEYYGQQALKIMDGATSATGDRGRLILNSSGLEGGAHKWKGDFTYRDIADNLRIADNQVRSMSAGNAPNTLSVNIAKSSALGNMSNSDLTKLIYDHRAKTGSNDLDEIFQSIIDEKELMLTSYTPDAIERGFRPGKTLADGKNMSKAWVDTGDKIDSVLYNIVKGDGSKYDMLPQDILHLPNASVRNYIGRMLSNSELKPQDVRINKNGSINMEIPYDPNSGFKSQNVGMNQLSEPYTLDKPVIKREIPKKKEFVSVPFKPKGSPEMEAKRKASALERARARQEMIEENIKGGFFDNYDDMSLADRHMQNTNIRYGDSIDDFAF